MTVDAGKLLSQFINRTNQRRDEPDSGCRSPANGRVARSPSGQQKCESKVRAEMQPLVVAFDRKDLIRMWDVRPNEEYESVSAKDTATASLRTTQGRSPTPRLFEGGIFAFAVHRYSIQADRQDRD